MPIGRLISTDIIAPMSRARSRTGRDPNYTLAGGKRPSHTKTRDEYHGNERSMLDALIDADYPRVDPEKAIEVALARLESLG